MSAISHVTGGTSALSAWTESVPRERRRVNLCVRLMNKFFCQGIDLPKQQIFCLHAPDNPSLRKCPYRNGYQCDNPAARRQAVMLQDGGY